MAAVTSSTVFVNTSVAGVSVGAKSSTPACAVLTNVLSSNGHRFIYVMASEAIASAETIKIGAAGSASSDSGSSGWTSNVPGGAATGQFFWAQRTTL